MRHFAGNRSFPSDQVKLGCFAENPLRKSRPIEPTLPTLGCRWANPKFRSSEKSTTLISRHLCRLQTIFSTTFCISVWELCEVQTDGEMASLNTGRPAGIRVKNQPSEPDYGIARLWRF